MIDDGQFDRWPKTDRPWPSTSSLENILQTAISSDYKLINTRKLGGRSLLLAGRVNCGSANFVALRQRSDDAREVLPLAEEAALLSFFAKTKSGSVIEPAYFHKPEDAGDESLLLLPWLKANRLGDIVNLQSRAQEAHRILEEELRKIHEACYLSSRPNLSRIVSAKRLLKRAKEWNPAKLHITDRLWREHWKRLEVALDIEIPKTILHGDPHAYNMLCFANNNSWVDFECAALGPPELDRARMLLLLVIQSGSIPNYLRRPTIQSAYDILVAGEWLQCPPHFCTGRNIRNVRQIVEVGLKHLESCRM